MTDQAQPQPLNEGAEERGRLFQRLGTPAISLSVLVAVLYLLGFVGLYMPIYHHFISDPFTAMHAVSEIPHTVVIGEGILVFSTPASIAAAAIAFYILFIFLYGTRKAYKYKVWEVNEGGTNNKSTFMQRLKWAAEGFVFKVRFFSLLPSTLVTGVIVGMWASDWYDRLFGDGMPQAATPQLISATYVICFILVVIFGWVAGVLLGNAFAIETGSERFVVRRGTFTWAIVLCIATIALAAAPQVTSASTPPLPWVDLSLVRSSGEGSTTQPSSPEDAPPEHVEGFLLGHADGSWHVLSVNEITSIPNPKIENVSIVKGYGRFGGGDF